MMRRSVSVSATHPSGNLDEVWQTLFVRANDTNAITHPPKKHHKKWDNIDKDDSAFVSPPKKSAPQERTPYSPMPVLFGSGQMRMIFNKCDWFFKNGNDSTPKKKRFFIDLSPRRYQRNNGNTAHSGKDIQVRLHQIMTNV
jgi:hypothetical protein